MTYTISPSSFAFLYDNCKRCWWLKAHKRSVKRESLPAVFNHIDQAMKQNVKVEHLQAAGIPALSLLPGEWVRSKPFDHAGVQLVVNGKVDVWFTTENGIGITDYKTTKPSEDSVKKYARQVRSYQYAVEFPERGEPREVDYLGLYCFDPYLDSFIVNGSGSRAAIKGNIVAISIDIDRQGFEKYMETLCELLAMEEPPERGEACDTCAEIDRAAMFVADRQKAGAA